MYYVNFTNTQRQILRLLNITEKYWFVEYKFGVFSINHAWKEAVVCLCVSFFYYVNFEYNLRSKVIIAAARCFSAHYIHPLYFKGSVHPNYENEILFVVLTENILHWSIFLATKIVVI